MNYNPYAAPQATPPPQAPGAGAGAPQPWEIGEVLAQAWDVFKIHWAPLVFAPVVAFVIEYVLGQIPRVIVPVPTIQPMAAPDPSMLWDLLLAMWPLLAIQSVLGLFVGSFFDVGILRIQIAAARGESPSFADLFSGAPKMLPVLALRLILSIAMTIGLVLFIVPGIIVFVILWAAEYYCIDADQGVFDAIKSSVEAVRGQWLALTLFFLLGLVITYAGLVGCCVGICATHAIYRVAKAIIFLRISGRGAVAPPLPPHAVPPGGYGGYGGYGGWPPPQPPPPQ